MVFFVCEVCNESLKKNKVETHSYSCKNCWVLICVDCNKSFNGDTYAAHTSCMTEAQRYEGKLYDGKSNKGDVKQAAWIARVHECAAEPSVAANLRVHVERLLGHDNIPRKKAKFENFAKNSLRLHDAKVLGALWGIFEKAAQPAARPGSAAGAAPASEAGAPEVEVAVAVAKEGAAASEAPTPTADKGAAPDAEGEAKKEKKAKKVKKDKSEKKEKKDKEAGAEKKREKREREAEGEDGKKKSKKDKK
ncbi:hypothetical protein T492DRAFT_989610 [Pavlovales sp. CCMP2436]|nr:hypothetical protein T492DRAFT_989610 [Pavlovales sp. CCMP2436]